MGGIRVPCVTVVLIETIELRIPTMSERSASGLHRPDRHRVNQAGSARRCSASRMKGELHRINTIGRTTCEADFQHLVRTFLHRDDRL